MNTEKYEYTTPVPTQSPSNGWMSHGRWMGGYTSEPLRKDKIHTIQKGWALIQWECGTVGVEVRGDLCSE